MKGGGLQRRGRETEDFFQINGNRTKFEVGMQYRKQMTGKQDDDLSFNEFFGFFGDDNVYPSGT